MNLIQRTMVVFMTAMFAFLLTAHADDEASVEDLPLPDPIFIRAVFSRVEPVLPGETAALSGQVVYDQRFSIHWDQVKYESPPFALARLEISKPEIAKGDDGLFYDAINFRLLLSVPSGTEIAMHAPKSLAIPYSSMSGGKRKERSLRVTMPKISVIPIRVKVALEKNIVRIGEDTELLVRIYRIPEARILNEYLSVLKDAGSSDIEKGEVERWAQSLEVRGQTAFNFSEPVMKPFVVRHQQKTIVQDGAIIRSEYRYRLSVGEAPGVQMIGPFSFWVLDHSGAVPQEKRFGPYRVVVQTGITSKRSEFEWLQEPQEFEFFPKWYGYLPMALGGLLMLVGFIKVSRNGREGIGKAWHWGAELIWPSVPRKRPAFWRLKRLLKDARESVDRETALAVRHAVLECGGALNTMPRSALESQTAADVYNAFMREFRLGGGNFKEAFRALDREFVTGEVHFTQLHANAILDMVTSQRLSHS